MATVAQSPSSAPSQPRTARQNMWKDVRSSIVPWLFILPPVIVMLLITFTPQAYQIGISFTDFEARNLGGTAPNYLGLDNFRQVMTNAVNVVNYNFFPLLGFNIVWTLINVTLHASIGLAVALALNAQHVIGRRIYRVIFVLPWALPGYITALIWNNLWQQNNGGFNLLMESINDRLGTNLPTRTAWLTNLEPTIDLRALVPWFIIIVCTLIVVVMVRRSLKNGFMEDVKPGTPPLFHITDLIGYAGVLLVVLGFFFLPWITLDGGSISAFGTLWNFNALGGVIDLQLLLLIFFASLIAIGGAIFSILAPASRSLASILLFVAGGLGVFYFLVNILGITSITGSAQSAAGYWAAFVGSILLVAQTFVRRPVLSSSVTKRLSVGRTVFTGGIIALLSLAVIGTLVDVFSSGGVASNAVVQLFDRAGAPVLAFWAVLVANVWLGWPFMMVVATGALQSIPPDLYEAADVDGASKWTQFRSITLPLLRPAMVPAIMLGTVWTFNAFNVIFFITAGGPRNQTDLLVTQAYKLIQQEQVYGVAAAFSIVVFFILLVITLIQNRVTRATRAFDEA